MKQTTFTKQHRMEFREFAVEHSDAALRPVLRRLYRFWDGVNERYFEGAMLPPYILLATPSTPTRLGDYSPLSGFGGYAQIRIRKSLLTGNHPQMRAGERFAEGRMLFIEDVLLHEVIHQYQHEIVKKSERSYRGHGPMFADACNRIGATMDLPRVRIAKARGILKSLPSCAHWPHCVRPDNYYLGAYLRGKNQE